MVPRGKHVQPLKGPEKAFGQAFRAIREEKGISQEQVSSRAECDRTTVSLIERGLVSTKLETIVKLCKAVNALPSDVMRRMEKLRSYR
jgi:transcriptional regulator with XRE-family HTH domain